MDQFKKFDGYLDENTYNFIYSKSVRVCVDLLVVNANGVILGKRSHEPFKDQYLLPGGRIFHGETIAQSIQRISEAEIGTKVIDVKLFTTLEYPEEKNINGYHSIALVFSCRADKHPFNKSLANFSDLSTSDLIKPEFILPKHLQVIKDFYRNTK